MSMERMIEGVYIIVPVYNVENYVKKCIESILSQSLAKIRVIIVNDGSTDNSGEICDFFSKKNENVVYIHQKNKGLAGARNTGIDFALNEVGKDFDKWTIAFIDSDDYIHREMFASLTNIMEDNRSDIAGVDARVVDEDEVVNEERKDLYKTEILNSIEFARRYLNHTASVSVCNKLFRMRLFNEIRFAEGRLNEDGLLLYEMFLRFSCNYVHLSRDMYYYVSRAGSISRCGFGKSTVDLIGNFQNVEKITLELAPELKKDANDNMLYACASFCNTIPMPFFLRNKKDVAGTVIKEVRARKGTIHNANIKKRDKLMLQVFAICPNVTILGLTAYRKILKQYRGLKK